jgi:phosphoribosyl 1,2-cyclic phosphate phosphodiesterase
LKKVKVVFLGTGTSHGVPEIGCQCPVCCSHDQHDKRTRSSVWITIDNYSILIDTSPDLRFQALRENIHRVDAVIYTHTHADHLMGIDELRKFNYLKKDVIEVYGSENVLLEIKNRFSYINFSGIFRTAAVPQLKLIEGNEFVLAGVKIELLPIYHGDNMISGIKVGDKLAYFTDCSGIPEETMSKIRGIDYLVLGALRDKPHPKHFSFQQAIDMALKLKVKNCYLTHISHRLSHAKMQAESPEFVNPAYDSLRLEIEI